MMENYDKEYWGNNKCPRVDCKKDACKCGLKKVFLASALGDDSEKSPIAPKNGAYCNAIVVYEANDHVYIYSTEGVPTLINVEGSSLEEVVEQLEKDLEKEVSDREQGDNTLQQEIDDLKNSPDVVDIVDTYADLQAYDTSHLGDKDIIRVLIDETHDGASSYYRWDKQTETWTYIGSIQTAANTIFYADLSETGNTRHIYKNSDMTDTVSVQELLDANEDGQVILRMSSTQTPENFNDAYLQNTYVGVDDYQFLFLDNRNYYEYDGTATTDTSYYYSRSTIQLELTAGSNITITGNTISATDTTYSAFTGTDGTAAGTAGLVPAPATTDAGKFLKADGTWDTAGGGGVITELTSADYNYPTDNPTSIALWLLDEGLYIIKDGTNYRYYSGSLDAAYGDISAFVATSITFNNNLYTTGLLVYSGSYNDALVFCFKSSQSTGQMDQILDNRYGLVNNLTSTLTSKALTAKQGKTLKDLIDGLLISGAGAPTTSTAGTVGQLYEDTTNGKLYICTDATNPYVWEEVGAGGGGPTVVQTTGTSQTDVMSQDATTKMIYPFISISNPDAINMRGSIGADNYTGIFSIAIGAGSLARGGNSVAMGVNAYTYASGEYSVALGNSANAGDYSRSVALGNATIVGANNSVAIGTNAATTRVGEVNIGAGTSGRGYNSTNYRVLGGVHDPVDAHDAATKGYVDGLIGACRELTSADYNYDSDGDTVNDTVALWLLPPGVYWWEYSFGSNGGVKFTTSSSGTLTDTKLLTFSQQVMIGYYGDANSGFNLINAFSRNVLLGSSDFGWAPYVPYVVNTSSGAVVNFQTDAIPVGRGDVNI